MPAESQLLPVLVGTAGHVDHGKTALVQLLTGCSTDRLPEEQARGLTIELGFASCPLPGRRRVGIVDVPGHEDFIRNMVAGASAVDVLLLVVAADDGVMAQTVEHLRIVRHFSRGLAMAAVTKADLVDGDTVELACAEVAELLHEVGYPEAPVVPVSNRSGEGIDRVRSALDALVAQREGRAPDERAFRMPIERSFQVAGRGAVATGVPVSGTLAEGDAVELLPGGTRGALRGLQCFGSDSPAAVAGTCNALLLRDIPFEALARGAVLAAPDVYSASTGVVVSLRGMQLGQALKRRQELRVHAGTAAVRAVCKLLDAEALTNGDSCFAHLACDEPLVVAVGDRILLRSLNPQASVATGVVLGDAVARAPKRRTEVFARLAAAHAALADDDLIGSAMLTAERLCWRREELLRATQLPPAAAEERLHAAIERDDCFDLGAGWLLHAGRRGEFAQLLDHRLTAYHADHPSTWGMESAQACAAVALPTACFAGLVAAVAGRGIVKRHGRLAREGFTPNLSQAQLQLRERVWKAVREGGAKAPAIGSLQQELGCRKQELQQLARLLQEEGLVLVYGSSLVDAILVERAWRGLVAHCREHGGIDMAAFRALSGFSRNLAVAVLDRFDQEGRTRRDGDLRRLLRDA